MNKLLFVLFFAFSFLLLHAQKVYFPATWVKDSVTMDKALPALAAQVAVLYNEPDKRTYFENLFRVQMVAGDNEKALGTLDSLRMLSAGADPAAAAVLGIQFEAFARTKIAEKKTQAPFQPLFRQTLEQLYDQLPPGADAMVTSYFSPEMDLLRSKFNELIQIRQGQDSAMVDDAVKFLRWFNSWRVYSQVIPVAVPMLTALEQRRYIVEDSLLIRTHTGAQLSAVVARPKNVSQPLPAVFIFNIYASGTDRAEAKAAAAKGFAGIVVNTRGKHLSPDSIEPFEHDAADAWEAIDWISRQSWCNGKVGMLGGSYLGFAQWAATKRLHPALKTIIPQVAVGIGIDYPMFNNVFMSYMLRWIHFVTNNKETDQPEFIDDKRWNSVFQRWYLSGAAFNTLDSVDGRPNYLFQRWLSHPAYDNYWQQMVPYRTDFSKINIPVLTTTGYFDDDQFGALYYYREHLRWNPNANHTLLIGPWDHYAAQSAALSEIQGYELDTVARISVNDIAFQWFDHILRGGPRPAMLAGKVNYELMSANIWKHANNLRSMYNDNLRLFFSNVRTGSTYRLSQHPGPGFEFIRQEIDLSDRSDSSFTLPTLIVDSTLKQHPSAELSFETCPFEKGFDIAGSFSGALNIAINKKDVDVSLRLYERRADGSYFSLGQFQARASYSNNRSARSLLQPGRKTKVVIDHGTFTAKHIAKGSRIVAVIGIVKNRDWQLNYGTGKDVSKETIADAKEPLRIQWFSDSFVQFPTFK